MKNHFFGQGVFCWYIADAVAIGLAIGWPGWAFPLVTWLSLVTTFVFCGRIPVRRGI